MSDPVIDWEMVMENLGDKATFYEFVQDLFDEESKKQSLPKTEQAIKDRNWQSAYDNSHAIRGALSNLGVKSLAEMIRDSIEVPARSLSPPKPDAKTPHPKAPDQPEEVINAIEAAMPLVSQAYQDFIDWCERTKNDVE